MKARLSRLSEAERAQREELLLFKARLEASKEREELLLSSENKLKEAFQALSLEALQSASRSFLDLATAKLEKFQEGAKVDLKQKQDSISDLVKPLYDSLKKADETNQELRRSLAMNQAAIAEQVKALAAAQVELRGETHRLAKALHAPNARGRWGEMQLKRVVEIAGMVQHCDFEEQPLFSGRERRLRPDMVVHLPGGKQIVVDSKAPLQSYLEALEAQEEEKKRGHMAEHARHVRRHIGELASKSYWDQFDSIPEFVVLFLPGEPFFSAALEADPSLIEYGVKERVILATPTTLISLLRAAAYGWNQERIAENAQQISLLGKTLYERIQTLASHFIEMRRHLERTIDSFNRSVGSFEGRVLVSARKLKEAGAGTETELEELEPVEKAPRFLRCEQEAG